MDARKLKIHKSHPVRADGWTRADGCTKTEDSRSHPYELMDARKLKIHKSHPYELMDGRELMDARKLKIHEVIRTS